MEGERARGYPQNVAFAAHLLDGDHESVFSQSAERLQRHVFPESRRRASAVAPSPRDRLGHEQRRGAFVCLLGLPSNPVVVAGRIDVVRIAASVRFLLMPRWSVGAVYQRSLWRDPFFAQGLPDLRGSTAALTVDYVQQGVPSRLGFVDVW